MNGNLISYIDIFCLFIITMGGLITFCCSLFNLLRLKRCTHIYAECTYADDEEKFKEDTFSPGKGFRCRYVFEHNNERFILIERGQKAKPNIGDKFDVYIHNNVIYSNANKIEYIRFLVISMVITIISCGGLIHIITTF